MVTVQGHSNLLRTEDTPPSTNQDQEFSTAVCHRPSREANGKAADPGSRPQRSGNPAPVPQGCSCSGKRGEGNLNPGVPTQQSEAAKPKARARRASERPKNQTAQERVALNK